MKKLLSLSCLLFALMLVPGTANAQGTGQFAAPPSSSGGSGDAGGADNECGEESDDIAGRAGDVENPGIPYQPRGGEGWMQYGSESVEEFHKTAKCRTITVFDFSKRIFYIYSGVGLGVLVLLAFIGRWQWKWFFAFVGGLFVVAAAQAIVEFLT